MADDLHPLPLSLVHYHLQAVIEIQEQSELRDTVSPACGNPPLSTERMSPHPPLMAMEEHIDTTPQHHSLEAGWFPRERGRGEGRDASSVLGGQAKLQ